MGFKIPQYPVELTNAGWQKKKGLLAKIAGETGIGDLLKALNSEYDKIDWLKFQLAISAKGQGSKRTKQDVKDAYEIALVEAKKLLKVDSAARDVERKAAMLVLKWKKDKAIPGASVKVAEEVGAKAKEFCYAVTLGTIMDALDKERKECDESVDKIANEYKKLNDTFRHYVNGFESACAGKTLSDYPTI